jgi:hypothetical protein
MRSVGQKNESMKRTRIIVYALAIASLPIWYHFASIRSEQKHQHLLSEKQKVYSIIGGESRFHSVSAITWRGHIIIGGGVEQREDLEELRLALQNAKLDDVRICVGVGKEVEERLNSSKLTDVYGRPIK